MLKPSKFTALIAASMALIAFVIAYPEAVSIPSSSQRLGFANPGGGFVPPTRMNPGTGGGDITDVIAGTGLTGGAATGAATVNVACGSGITCAADSISLDPGALFSTNNVIPKGDGVGLTASSWTDDGTTSTTTGALSVTGVIQANDGLLLSVAGENYIYGTLSASAGNQSINITSAGTGLVRINGNVGGLTNGGTGGLIVYPGANSSTPAITLAANGDGTFTGNVQVGPTAATAKVHVSGATNGLNDGAVKITSNKTAWGNITSQLQTTAGGSTTTDKLAISIDSGSINLSPGGLADAMVISHSGQVGINRTPITQTKLDVAGAVRLTVTSGGDGFVVGTSTKQWGTYPVGNDLRFWEYNGTIEAPGSGGDRMVLEAGGNVGIGQTNPAFLLDVNGTFNAEGNVTLNGSATTVGNANTDTLTVTAKIDSKVYYTGTAPALSACGTASATIVGNDRLGRVIPGTGSPTSCTITFASAYTTNAPVCVISGKKGTEQVSSVSTTALVVTVPVGWSSAAGGGADEPWYYHCDGRL